MKFSIIVPVYNVENYLEVCVNSIISQREADFEIILVDDGSTDKSGEICDKFALDYPEKLKVIHQENLGVAVARNKAIEYAQGDYILFLDGDDYLLENTALKQIENRLQESKADILIFNFSDDFQGKLVAHIGNPEMRGKLLKLPSNQGLQELIKAGLIRHLVWDKIVKTDLIKKNKLSFLNVNRLEDSEFFGQLIAYADSYDYCETALYAYRKRGGSETTRAVSEQIIKDYDQVFDSVEALGKALADKERQENFWAYHAYPYLAALGIAELYCKKHRLKNQGLRSKSFLLKFDFDPKVKSVTKIYKIFGQNLTYFVLRLAAKRRVKVE